MPLLTSFLRTEFSLIKPYAESCDKKSSYLLYTIHDARHCIGILVVEKCIATTGCAINFKNDTKTHFDTCTHYSGIKSTMWPEIR